MWAAAVVVITAGSRLERAASPAEAEVVKLVHAAAGASLRTCVVIITHRGRFHWSWRRWARIRRVRTGLDGV